MPSTGLQYPFPHGTNPDRPVERCQNERTQANERFGGESSDTGAVDRRKDSQQSLLTCSSLQDALLQSQAALCQRKAFIGGDSGSKEDECAERDISKNAATHIEQRYLYKLWSIFLGLSDLKIHTILSGS